MLERRLSISEQQKKTLKKVGTRVATGVLALSSLTACGPDLLHPFGVGATASPTPSASGEVSPKPSASPSFLPSISPSASPSKGPETQQNQETYTLLNIESESWSATTFGADDWSKDPNNWEVVNQPNGDKYAHLKQRPNQVHTMVDLTKDSRAVGQAWAKIKTTDSGIERFVNNQVLDAQAETIVFRNEKGEVKEVTIRIADNTDALMKDSYAKMVAKEAAEQPGTPVLPCQPVIIPPSTKSVPTPTPSPTLPPAK